MNQLKVNLWGKEIGYLVWNSETGTANFVYNSDLQDIPDIAPILSPVNKRSFDILIYGDERPLYQGLPPFIADSLPDSWGNSLIDLWFKTNKTSSKKITPLDKLAFIGSRGMGALEFEPISEGDFPSSSLNPSSTSTTSTPELEDLDINSLYKLSLKISQGKDNHHYSGEELKTLDTLISTGTSAGGRQPKIIISIDKSNGALLPGYIKTNDPYHSQDIDYYLLKFSNPYIPFAEIEYAYYLMATSADIEMEPSQLLNVEEINHFITRRFDRKVGKKILAQTLAAINPEASSYEDIISTCNVLNLSEKEISQLYRRLVFNVLANNTDDHNKNIGFILEEGGMWHLAPAYDLTFIFNETGTGPNRLHRMSVRGKRSCITKDDLLDFAHEHGISDAETIMDEMAKSLSQFDSYASTSGIPQPWQGIIQNTIASNLLAFGYHLDKANGNGKDEDSSKKFIDSYGRTIESPSVAINSKGHYELSAIIDGNRKRRFIRPNMPQYNQLREQNLYNLPQQTFKSLIETLLPPQ